MFDIEELFVNQIKFSLKGFIKKNNVYNFSCPYCGDSRRSKNKKRGYIIKKGNYHFYYCHNCGTHKTFSNFLKDQNAILYKQYVMEKIKLKSKSSEALNLEETKEKNNVDDDNFSSKTKEMVCVNKLDKEHIAIKYLQKRKIPESCYKYIFYTKHFEKIVNRFVSNKFEKEEEEDQIVFLIYDNNKKLIGMQSRLLNSKEKRKRYKTISFGEGNKLIFGLDRVDISKKIYVFEGIFDSLMMENSVAILGSHLNSILHVIDNKENLVFIFDNERENLRNVKMMEKLLKEDCNVCIYNNDIKEKDLNEIVINNNFSQEQAKIFIDSMTYKGLKGMHQLSVWRRRL